MIRLRSNASGSQLELLLLVVKMHSNTRVCAYQKLKKFNEAKVISHGFSNHP